MKKQLIFPLSALCAVILIFLFGTTAKPKPASAEKDSVHTANSFDINAFIDSAKLRLSPTMFAQVDSLQTFLDKAPSAAEKAAATKRLAAFWKDSARSFEAYAYYTAEDAALDKSEKNLNFAARLFLENLRHEQDPAKLDWETAKAIDLFQEALKLDPQNEDLRIGLGSAYIFGRGRKGDGQETMKGVRELLAVVRDNPSNMKAQLTLGIGGLLSGQHDKAIERLKIVTGAEPSNVEAVMYLADAYAAKGEKAEAVKWYNLSKRLINDPHYSREVDERIKQIP